MEIDGRPDPGCSSESGWTLKRKTGKAARRVLCARSCCAGRGGVTLLNVSAFRAGECLKLVFGAARGMCFPALQPRGCSAYVAFRVAVRSVLRLLRLFVEMRPAACELRFPQSPVQGLGGFTVSVRFPHFRSFFSRPNHHLRPRNRGRGGKQRQRKEAPRSWSPPFRELPDFLRTAAKTQRRS
jgi:hypothetical protein